MNVWPIDGYVAGIDPSLTGTAVVVGGQDGHAAREFTSKPSGQGLRRRLARFHTLVNEVDKMLAEWAPELVLIEGYSFSSKGQMQLDRIEFGGLLRDRLASTVPNVVEVTPASLKKFATGRGNASKAEVVSALTHRYRSSFRTDNEADAYGLWQLGLCIAGQVTPQTKQQDDVTSLVRSLLDVEAGRAA